MLFWLALSAASPVATPVRLGLPAGVQAVGTARVRIVTGVRIAQGQPLPAGATRTGGITNFQ